MDDVPANASYWARLQQHAFGFKPSEVGWGENWRSMEPASLFRPEYARGFADFIEEFGVRGKFSFLPCPAGLGRVDRSVRGFKDSELRDLISVVRDRISKQMDITPEVLTHSMALDPETGALLPHAETAWVSHLCATRQMDKLKAYLHHGYTILRNVGLEPHGVTTGGMVDVSGIAKGELVYSGHHRDVLAEALLSVERKFRPRLKRTFLYTGSPPVGQRNKKRRAPTRVFESATGVVWDVHSPGSDPLFDVLHGPHDRVERTTDAMISRDLSKGLFVEEAEAGRALVFTVHAQTLMSMNTGTGIMILREVCRRLRDRFGRRLVWHTADELCEKMGT